MTTGSNIHVHIKERDSASCSWRSLEPVTYMENCLIQALQRKQIRPHTMDMFSPLTSHISAPVSTKHIMTARNKTHRSFEPAFSTSFHCTWQAQFSTVIWEIWHFAFPSMIQAMRCLKELIHTRAKIFLQLSKIFFIVVFFGTVRVLQIV